MDDLSVLFQSLSVGDNQVAVLEQLKSFFIALPSGYLRQHAPEIDFTEVFECLKSTERKQIELACDVLQRIFRSLSPDTIYQRYKERFLQCLNHDSSLTREVALRQLQYSVDQGLPALLSEICENQELIYKCGSLLGDEELAVALEACKLFSKLVSTDEGRQVFFKPSFLHHLENVSSKNDAVRFRIYELFIQISCQSEEYLTLCLNANLIQPILTELSKDDVLVQLNALELLSTLATYRHTLSFLINQGVLNQMNDALANRNDNPVSKFLLPGITKLFGTVARIEPKIVLQRYPAFTDFVFSAIADKSDTSSMFVAMETLGFIGEGLEGKIALSEHGSRMDEALAVLGRMLRNSPTDYKVKCLESLILLFDLKGQVESSEFLRLMSQWFQQLDRQPLDMLIGIMKQPFPELRLPALRLLGVLSEQAWCQEAMNLQPGLPEFLMDRAVEPNQECRNAKYEVVGKLSRSPCAPLIFGQSLVRKFQEHFREGPYFFRSQAEVAMESRQ